MCIMIILVLYSFLFPATTEPRFKQNPGSDTPIKQFVPVKKLYPMDKNLPKKMLHSSTTGVAVKKLNPSNKCLSLKRTIPKEHVTAKKILLTRKGLKVKKPAVAIKRAVAINKFQPEQKVAVATELESPKKISAVKKIVPIDHGMAEKKQSIPATKKETTTPPAKEKLKEEVKKTSPITDFKKLSSAKTLTLETEHENKVWQELSGEPINKEEKQSIEKSGNEASDDLKNVPGLDNNKGQLNMQNSLYVKIYFTDRPPKGTLTEFINKYKLQCFKRIDNSVNLFAAKLNNMDDFEYICNAKEVYCGQVKVTVKPCYKYSSHPPRSRTTSIVENDRKENREEKYTFVQNDKMEETHKEISQEKHTIESINHTEKSEKPHENPKDLESLKDSVNTNNNSPMKPDNSPNETLKVAKSNKHIEAAANESNVNILKDNRSIKEKIKFDNDSDIVNKLQITNKNIKEQAINKLESKDITEKKLPKDISESNITKDTAKIKTTKNVNRQEDKKGVPNAQKKINKEVKKLDKNTVEDEEMDDQDILALISEGIVLDECCDSDQEL